MNLKKRTLLGLCVISTLFAGCSREQPQRGQASPQDTQSEEWSASSERAYESIMGLNRDYEAAKAYADVPVLKKKFNRLRSAIQSTKDQNALARIALAGGEDTLHQMLVGEDVVRGIQDQSILAKVAIETVDDLVASRAIEGLNDPSLLMAVATNKDAKAAQEGFPTPWHKLSGMDRWGKVVQKVPPERLEFVAFYIDPDDTHQKHGDADRLLTKVLDNMSDAAVAKIVARRSEFLKREEEQSAYSGPLEQKDHRELFKILLSRVLKIDDREKAIASLGALSTALSNPRAGNKHDFLTLLRKREIAPQVFVSTPHPVSTFGDSLQQEERLDIALAHPDKEERIEAFQQMQAHKFYYNPRGYSQDQCDAYLKLALKSHDPEIAEKAKELCDKDDLRGIELVARFAPNDMDAPVSDILERAKAFQKEDEALRIVEEFDPEFYQGGDFDKIVEKGKAWKEIKFAVDGIRFQLQMTSPQQLLDAANRGEIEISTAFKSLDFTSEQSAYSFGKQMGTYVRNVRAWQNQCDSAIDKINGLLGKLPENLESPALNAKVEEVRTKGNDAMQSFRSAKSKLEEKEREAMELAETLRNM